MTDRPTEGMTPNVATETADMAPNPDPVIATETTDMAPPPTGSDGSDDSTDPSWGSGGDGASSDSSSTDTRTEQGEVNVVEWIVSSCTGFFTGDEETIREFGEDPEGWCATNLPPDCGPQDVARCMPQIMERCGGDDSESSHHLARYCGTFSHNATSTYSSHHESSSSSSSHGDYSAGSHCACETVVNEICYTVNVYHQTNIYTHVEIGGTSTGCFGDRTPCTTTELDDDFDCHYPEEIPTWDPSVPATDSWAGSTETMQPGEVATETPAMAPTADPAQGRINPNVTTPTPTDMQAPAAAMAASVAAPVASDSAETGDAGGTADQPAGGSEQTGVVPDQPVAAPDGGFGQGAQPDPDATSPTTDGLPADVTDDPAAPVVEASVDEQPDEFVPDPVLDAVPDPVTEDSTDDFSPDATDTTDPNTSAEDEG